MSDNTHAEISAQRDGDVTVPQVNYLISLYKETIKKSILKSHKNLDKTADYANFVWSKNKSRDALKGKFGIHLHVQYIPENKLTKNKVSSLINDALNSKFDLKFAKSLVASCNKYKKVSSWVNQSNQLILVLLVFCHSS